MKKTVVRIPKQERSIQKRKVIIQVAFELFSTQGYFKTDSAEIAKEASVSTGLVYSYFKDKRDILEEVVNLYIFELEEK